METKNTINKPIGLVFTMHKVGSSTVMQSFREIGLNPERGYEKNLDYLQPLSKYEAVVTPVRDPIARNISYFFEMNGEEIMELSLKDIFSKMMDSENHAYPLSWFDEVFEPAFGVDVYKRKFAKKRGWSIIDDRYLLVQTERMSDVLPNAFQSLFGETPPPIHRARTEEARPYGDLYSDFVEWVKFPGDFLDEMYDSKYVKHFYLKVQIEKMRSQWEK